MELKELLGDSYKENMTIEDVAEALKDKTLVDPATIPTGVSKTTFDKVASELAALKREKREMMATEKNSKEDYENLAEQMKNIIAENEQMKRERQFIKSGYDEETATTLAESLANNDMDKFFQANSSFIESVKKDVESKVRNELLEHGTLMPHHENRSANGTVEGAAHPAEEMARLLAKKTAASTAAQNSVLEKFANRR